MKNISRCAEIWPVQFRKKKIMSCTKDKQSMNGEIFTKPLNQNTRVGLFKSTFLIYKLKFELDACGRIINHTPLLNSPIRLLLPIELC